MSLNNLKRGFNEGKFAAHSFGAEFQANPGSSRREYLDSAAWYFGKETFSELSDEEKTACRSEFERGIADEKKAQNL